MSRMAAEGSGDGDGDGDGEVSVRGVEQEELERGGRERLEREEGRQGGSGGLEEDWRGRKGVRKEGERMSERESGL